MQKTAASYDAAVFHLEGWYDRQIMAARQENRRLFAAHAYSAAQRLHFLLSDFVPLPFPAAAFGAASLYRPQQPGSAGFFAGMAAGKPAIAFGDYSYYNIGDRGTRSFKQLNELFAGNGMIGFVAKERVDGKLILPEAVQILKVKPATTTSK